MDTSLVTAPRLDGGPLNAAEQDFTAEPTKDHHEVPVKPRAALATTNRATEAASFVFSGRFLPLLTDKVRNNVRSRPTLILLYAVSTAFVCLLLIAAVSFSNNAGWTVRFGTAPATEVYLGEPFPTFSLQVVDTNNKGVSGQLVYVYVMPLSEVDLVVSLDEGSLVSRQLECIRDMAMVLSPTYNDDYYFCNPVSSGLVLNAQATTNARGLAVFQNMILGFGIIGPYALTVGLTSVPELYVTHIFNVKSGVQSIDIVKGLNANFDLVHISLPVATTSPVDGTLTSDPHTTTTTVEVTLSFVPSLRFQAYLHSEEIEAAAKYAAGYLGISVPEYIQTVADQTLGPLPSYICGAIIALNMQQSGITQNPSVLEPLHLGTSRTKGMRFVNNVACNGTVVATNLTALAATLSTVGGSSGAEAAAAALASEIGSFSSEQSLFVYTTTLRFEHFGIVGSNSDQMFLGVSAMGMTIPLPAFPLASEYQSPSQIIAAASLQTNVSSVVVSCPQGVAHNWTTVEVAPFVSLTAVVKDAAGNPLVNRWVFLHAEPNVKKNRAANVLEGQGTMLNPSVNPKSLLFSSQLTDASGIAELTNARFSAVGSAGYYDIFATVDGVPGVWDSTGGTSQTVLVVTSVASAYVVFADPTGANAAVEHVGETWSFVPSVAVFTAANVPIPGKTINVVARNQKRLIVNCRSLDSNMDGVSYITDMVVSLANLTAEAMAAMAANDTLWWTTPTMETFDVVIDGAARASFTRWLAPPRNVSWVMPPRNASRGESTTGLPYGACAGVRLLSAPIQGYFNMPYHIIVMSVDSLGFPVPNASLTVVVDNRFLPPMPGQSVYSMSASTDAQGLALIPASVARVANVFSMVAMMYCSGSATSMASPGYLYLDFSSRVKTATLSQLLPGLLCADVEVQEPEAVSEEYPVSFTVLPVWYPSYVTNFLPTSSFPVATMSYLTNASSSLATRVSPSGLPVFTMCSYLSNSSISTFPQGMYAFEMLIDNNLFTPLVFSSITSLRLRLRLVRSMFTSLNSTQLLHVGQRVPQQPIVQVIDDDTGDVVSGVTVFQQNVATRFLGGKPHFQDIYSDATELRYGGVASISSSGFHQSAAVSDPDGIARFDNLTLVALLPGYFISARYCVSLHALLTLNFTTLNVSTDTFTVCVDDPGQGVILFTEYATFTANTETVTGAPGQMLPTVSITAKLADGISSPPAIMCTPVMVGAAQSTLVFPSSPYTMLSAYGTFRALGGQLTIQNAIQLAASTSAGTYMMLFVCTGGVTSMISIVVTSTPVLMCLSNPLTLPATVRSVVPIEIQLLGAGALPVALRDVQLSITNDDKNISGSACSGLPCGLLDASSTLYTTTDNDGYALFTLILSDAAPTNLTVTLQVAPSLSNTGVKQFASMQLTAISGVYGMPTANIVGALVAALGGTPVANLLRIAADIASKGTSSTTTTSTVGTQVLYAASTLPNPVSPNTLTCDAVLAAGGGGGGAASPSSAGGASGTSTSTAKTILNAGKTALMSNVGAFLGPIEGIIEMLASAVSGGGGGSSGSSSSDGSSVFLSFTLPVENTVTNGTLMQHSPLPDLVLPLALQEVVAIAPTASASFTLSGASSPVVQYARRDGSPASGAIVFVEVLPLGQGCTASTPTTSSASNSSSTTSNVTSSSTTSATFFVANDDGVAAISPLTVTCTQPGTYWLRFSVSGGGAVETTTFAVTQTQGLTRWDYMKYLAAFLVVFFSPMLMASVPHSRSLYLPFACVVAIIALLFSRLGSDLVPRSQPLYEWYFYFLLGLTSLLVACIVSQVVLDIVSWRDLSCCCSARNAPSAAAVVAGGRPSSWWQLLRFRLRISNDEVKALRTLMYARWITNIRLTDQEQLWDSKQAAKQNAVGNRLKLLKYRVMQTGARAVNDLTNRQVLDEQELEYKTWRRTRRVAQTSLIYGPSEAFDPVYAPINFFIVVGIAIVMLVSLCFVIVYVYQYLLGKANLLVSYLPDTSDGATAAQLHIVNMVLVNVVIATVDIVVRILPQFASLGTMSAALKNVDVVSILATFRSLINDGIVRLEVAFWVGGSVACIAFIVTLITTYITIPATLRRLRRGSDPDFSFTTMPAISSNEAYIGMHSLTLLVLHQVVFWPVTLIVFLLSITPLRVFLWDKLEVIIVGSIVSYVTQTLVIKIIVGKYLTYKRFTAIRPELYSIWHFVGLILGIFSGVMICVVRWATSLGLISALFARLDQAIYPRLFASRDKGYTGFMSVVTVEAANGHPIYLTFATLLIFDQEMLKRVKATRSNGLRSKIPSPPTARTRDSSPDEHPLLSPASSTSDAVVIPVDDSLLVDDRNTSAVVKNMCRMLLRSHCTEGCPLDLRVPPIAGVSDHTPVAKMGLKGLDPFVPKLLHPTVRLTSESTATICKAASVDASAYIDAERWRRRQRVLQRWWLYVVLHFNPSLLLDRKHRMYYDPSQPQPQPEDEKVQQVPSPNDAEHIKKS